MYLGKQRAHLWPQRASSGTGQHLDQRDIHPRHPAIRRHLRADESRANHHRPPALACPSTQRRPQQCASASVRNVDAGQIGTRYREGRQFGASGHHNAIKAMPLAGGQGNRARGGVQCGGALPQP